MGKITNSVIKSEKFLVKAMTTAELATMGANLPTAQKVRGSVWKDTVKAGLVQDIKDGKYVPPLVLAGDADTHDMSDGQQRLLAIMAGVDAGVLTGEEVVLLAVDTGRTFEESFRVLNIGVPVGAGLVAAMSYEPDVQAAVLGLANHRLFGLYKWTPGQNARTAKAEFASAALAICAGWQSPESSNSKVVEWLHSNSKPVVQDGRESKVIDAAAIEQTRATFDAIADAMLPYVADAARDLKVITGKLDRDAAKAKAKIARAILAALRKKSLFMTTVACVSTGSDASDTIAALERDDLLVDTMYTVTGRNGKPKALKAKWTVGGGSSGSNAEYVDRLHVLRAAALKVQTTPRVSEEVAAAGAAAEAETAAEALLAQALGG